MDGCVGGWMDGTANPHYDWSIDDKKPAIRWEPGQALHALRRE